MTLTAVDNDFPPRFDPAQFETPCSRTAAELHEMGVVPVPVKFASKQCLRPNWPQYECNLADFREQTNVGIILGSRSQGLFDVDVDCAEAARLVEWLPPTGMMWGRAGNPRSHFAYRVLENPPAHTTYADPVSGEMIIELRGENHLSVVPPSTHECGEPYEWEQEHIGEPTVTDGEALKDTVKGIAAASLLGRYWPEQGTQDTAMALAGLMLCSGSSAAPVENFIRMVCKAANDSNVKKRLTAVTSTVRAIEANEKVTGFTRLVERLGQPVASTLAEWLEISTPTTEDLNDTLPTTTLLTDDEELAIVEEHVPSLLGCGVMTSGAIGVVAGGSGTGKTLFLTNLVYHLAAGRDFLNLRVLNPLRVLFIEAENNKQTFRERRANLRAALGFSEAPNLLFLHPDTPLPQIGSSQLRQIVEDNKIEVVIFDSIGYFHSGEENSNSDWKNKVIKPLRQMAREIPWHPTFWMTHHFGKASENRQGQDRTRGASAIVADASTVLTLERKGDNHMLLSYTKIKDGPPMPEEVLHVDWSTGVITVTDEHPAMLDDRVKQIAEFVGDRELRHTELVQGIMKAFEVKETMAKDLVRSCVQAGVLVKAGKERSSPYTVAAQHAERVGGSEWVGTTH